LEDLSKEETLEGVSSAPNLSASLKV